MATFDAWDVVIVPFPFSERASAKRRPALVLSQSELHRAGHCLLAMITTGSGRAWPGDARIEDLDAAGLSHPCLVRLKIFTLDRRLIRRVAGRLSAGDRTSVEASIRRLIAV